MTSCNPLWRWKQNISPKRRYILELLSVGSLPIFRYSSNNKIQRFGYWIRFHPQVRRKETTILLCPKDRDKLSHWISRYIGTRLQGVITQESQKHVTIENSYVETVYCHVRQTTTCSDVFFTFEYCILLLIYLTDSLRRRQSQQSFNTLTPFNFLFYSLFRWDIQLVIISVFEGIF
jgi:hypothetical protein